MNRYKAVLLGLCLGLGVLGAPPHAETSSVASDAAIEARFKALTTELRCLVCQNQTIADSSAALAVDLRNEVQRMLKDGASDARIIEYMVARYGDFVLYRPPVKPITLLLWGAPALFLVAGLGGWILLVRSGNKPVSRELSDEERARALALLSERAQLRMGERQA